MLLISIDSATTYFKESSTVGLNFHVDKANMTASMVKWLESLKLPQMEGHEFEPNHQPWL